MSLLNFLISSRANIKGRLLSLNKTLASPIIPINKDLSVFGTNNTNSQHMVMTMFEDSTHFYAFTFGQSNNILNQDQGYAARIDKTLDINTEWPMIETAGVPDLLLPAGTSGQWDDWQVYWGNILLNTDDIVSDGATYITYYGGTNSNSVYEIGIATSNDLTTWTKYGSNPVFWDYDSGNYSQGNPFCKVVRLSANNYVMVYVGSIPGGAFKLNTATSADGLSWTVDTRGIAGDINTSLISDITLTSGVYYFMLAKTDSGGNLCDPTGARVSNGGPLRYIHLYSTTDFNTFTDEGVIYEHNQEVEEGVRPNGGFFKDKDGNWFASLGRYKWDIQTYNGLPKGEQFIESSIIKASFTDHDTPNNVAYSDYVDFYDVTRLTERTGKGYTGAWGTSPQVNMVNWIKPISDKITFTNRDIDIDNFAVKIKAYYPGTTFGDGSTGTLVAIRDLNNATVNVFHLFINNGDLSIVLWDGSGNIAKNYRTTLTLDNYIPATQGNDTVDLGFIFNAGTLKLSAGYTTDVPTTKTTDDTLTQLNSSSEPLYIGGYNNGTNYAGTDITGTAFLLGSEATESNWLKLSLF